MMTADRVQYFRGRTEPIELIVCRDSGISYPLHNHVSVFTAGLVLDGAVTLTLEGQATAYGAGRAFGIPPYAPLTVQAAPVYTLLTLCVRKDAAHRLRGKALRDRVLGLLDAVPGLRLTQAQTAELARSDGLMTADSRLHYREPRLAAVERRLEVFPERPLSVEKMAQAAYLSKYHFIRSFQRTVGLTPHQFQIQNRVRKAQRLMEHVESTAEVALAAGFCDQSHFIRHFEKCVGLTPAVYRAARRPLAAEDAGQFSAGMNFANR